MPDVVRYGGDSAFAPFESLDPQGKPQGFQIDLLGELGRAIGVRFDITLQPWARTESDFRRGALDVVAMVDTLQRRNWARFARGHATPAFAVYRHQGHADPQGLADLAGVRVAVLDGEAMRDTLATWLSGFRGPFMRMPDARQALSAVQQGQADVALLPRAYADFLIGSGSFPDVIASRIALVLQTYAFAVAPDNETLASRLQQGLDQLEQSGRLEALRTQWLSSHRDLAERDRLARGLAQEREWGWGLGALALGSLAVMGVGVKRRGQRIAAERQRRETAEGALQRAEELLERAFGHNPDPMLIIDQDGGLVRDANSALLSLLAVPGSTVIGQPLRSLAAHIDGDTLTQLAQSLDAEGSLCAAPLSLTRADGRRRDCLVSADPLRIGTETHVFCVLRDITEELARDAKLRRGYDELAGQLAQARHDMELARQAQARAEGSLQEFTRTVAHDLKTPLNAVQGFAGLLKMRLLAGHVQEAINYTDHIDRAARRMNSMVNALASLAQVTREPLQRQAVDMNRLAGDTWSLLAASHPERTVQFRADALPPAQADPDLAAQIWQNLLGNAYKYSARADKAKVLIDSYRDARGIWYRVADNGAGFDMAHAKQLFQPFQRLHSATEFEGSGVGLSLVKRIVEHHSGEIRLRSTPGVGTVAEFTLDPLQEPG